MNTIGNRAVRNYGGWDTSKRDSGGNLYGMYKNPGLYADGGKPAPLNTAGMFSTIAGAALKYSTPIGVGLDILSLAGMAYDTWRGNKEAEKAKAEQKTRDRQNLMMQMQQLRTQKERYEKEFKLNEKQALHRIKMDKDQQRLNAVTQKTNMVNMMQSKWLQSMNQPNNIGQYLKIMKGGR